MAQLVFFRGEEKLIEYRLQPGRTSIGRADSCDVAVPGESVSRTHCFVVWRGDTIEVIDRSRHGLTVDGKPVTRCSIQDGAELGLGPYRVVLRMQADRALPTAEVGADRGLEVVVGAGANTMVVEHAYVMVDAGPRRRVSENLEKKPYEHWSSHIGYSVR